MYIRAYESNSAEVYAQALHLKFIREAHIRRLWYSVSKLQYIKLRSVMSHLIVGYFGKFGGNSELTYIVLALLAVFLHQIVV